MCLLRLISQTGQADFKEAANVIGKNHKRIALYIKPERNDAMTTQEKYNERLQLIQDTIALKPTKRVVNAVRVNYWP